LLSENYNDAVACGAWRTSKKDGNTTMWTTFVLLTQNEYEARNVQTWWMREPWRTPLLWFCIREREDVQAMKDSDGLFENRTDMSHEQVSEDRLKRGGVAALPSSPSSSTPERLEKRLNGRSETWRSQLCIERIKGSCGLFSPLYLKTKTKNRFLHGRRVAVLLCNLKFLNKLT
jgi:hypothetical protein